MPSRGKRCHSITLPLWKGASQSPPEVSSLKHALPFLFPPKLTATDLVFHILPPCIYSSPDENQPTRTRTASAINPQPLPKPEQPPVPQPGTEDLQTTARGWPHRQNNLKKEPKPTPQTLHHSSGSSTQRSCMPFTATKTNIFSWRNPRQVAYLTAPYRYTDNLRISP